MQARNNLAVIRQKRGFSVATLAAQIGVKRQTIYAIEAGTYVPNTLIALKLAQVLETSVEELFAIDARPLVQLHCEQVHLLQNAKSSLQPRQPLRLCRVGKRLIGVHASTVSGGLPAADALLLDASSRKATAQPFSGEDDYGKRLLVAGCDPGMDVLARQMNRYSDVQLILASCSSSQALRWLKEKAIHVAGTHLRDEASGELNLPVVKKLFPRGGYRVITFAGWEQGLVVARGNPKRIRQVADLSRPDISLMNREPGAGSRFLLDSSLRKLGIVPTAVHGYERIAFGHMPAAWHVHSGEADCCIAVRAAAQVFGLGFVPLVTERYDLIVPESYLDLQTMRIMLDVMSRSSLKRELEALGGYDTSQTGRIVA
jgi:molybdate-binding protein/DNA-binding XRE family transcriptional regulator